MSPRPPDILRKSHRHAERKERATARDRLRHEVAAAMAEQAARECHSGRCNCGALGYRYFTKVPTASWSVLACDCERCRRSDALYVSDPAGAVELFGLGSAEDTALRFGSGQTSFAVCGRCGDLVAALLRSGAASYASVNIRRLDDTPSDLPASARTNLHEDACGERDRREAEWTPLIGEEPEP